MNAAPVRAAHLPVTRQFHSKISRDHAVAGRRNRRIVFFVSLLAWCGIASARGEIEFVGILVTAKNTVFALGDTTRGKTEWLGRGEYFSVYEIVSFEAKDDTLLLRRDGQDLRLRLKDDAKVKSARLELTGSITFGAQEKIEISRATLQFDQENVFPLQDGVTYRITPERRADGTILYRTSIERAIAANKTERVSAPAVTTLPGQPFSMRIGDLGFSFTPR